MKVKNAFLAIMVLSLLIFLSRMIPHSANYSPLIGLTLICGFFARGRWYGFVLPILAFVLSDLQLGLYPGWAFTYIPLVLAIALGHFLRIELISTIGLALGGALTFFLVSNFGVWLYSGMYTPDFSGLLNCYNMGVPFFRTTLLSTLGTMLGFYAFAKSFSLSGVKKGVTKNS